MHTQDTAKRSTLNQKHAKLSSETIRNKYWKELNLHKKLNKIDPTSILWIISSETTSYLSFFFVMASTTQSPTQLKLVPFGRRSTWEKSKHLIVSIVAKHMTSNYWLDNSPKVQIITLVTTSIIGFAPARSRTRDKKLPLKSTIST